MASADERILAVLFHAFTSGPSKLEGVARIVREAYPQAALEIHCPALPLSLFSTADPAQVASDQADEIGQLCADAERAGSPFTRIVFVGHSIGSLLARKVYIIACGETDRAPFEEAVRETGPRPWAHLVDRIILLAGMNRGWRLSHHLNPLQAAGWWLGTVLGRLWERITGGKVLILGMRVGSEFITQLRVQWLRMRQAAQRDENRSGNAMTIQLLGSIDDMVSPRDNVDLVAGSDFYYLDVPYSGHASIIEVDDRTEPPGAGSTAGAWRSEAIQRALASSKADLAPLQVLPADLDAVPAQHPDVTDVVFVIHGIRDAGYWTYKVARKVREAAGDKAAFIATETSSYGYFPMLPFLFSFRRARNVEWLMDEYAAAVALYPHAARFHFIGHSNGTYCLVEALRRYACCHFSRVVLAGAVVRSRLDWSAFLRDENRPDQRRRRHGSVEQVLNFVATGDLVVAAFPRLFETFLPIQRLGGAGHIGFLDAPNAVKNVEYVKGGHGAGVAEPWWPSIARFIHTGSVEPFPPGLKLDRQAWLARLLGVLPLLGWLVAVGIAVLLGWGVYLAAEWVSALLVAKGGPGANALLRLLSPAADWVVPVTMTLYCLAVIKLLRWV
ncbi:MAG TPA: hypothetical protein VF589_00230 [Allosphingosinicella sp.]|jgi:hypothetical protein